MNISTVSNANFARTQYELVENKAPLQKEDKFSPTSGSKDTVSISDAGMRALDSDASEGVKRFALPDWMGDFSAKVNILNNEDSTKIGYAAWEQDFRGSHKNELSEYGEAFNKHFEQAKKEYGITSQVDMYEKIIKSPENSESLRQSLVEKLQSDPEIMALMETLGIKRPE